MANASQIADALEAAISQACAALALEVCANLVEACPVDTGHCRRNFVPSIGAPHQGEDDGAAQAAGQAQVATSYRVDMGDLYVSNQVPYLPRLIMGSSAQAPAGWDIASIDKAIQTVRDRFGATINVSTSNNADLRGSFAAGALANIHSPFGDEG